jgi:hypothetical protein
MMQAGFICLFCRQGASTGDLIIGTTASERRFHLAHTLK